MCLLYWTADSMDFQIICNQPENILADLLVVLFCFVLFFNKICIGLLGQIKRGFSLISVFM